MRRARVIPAALVSVALLLAACGQGGEDEPPAGDGPDVGAPDDGDGAGDGGDTAVGGQESADGGDAPADLDEFVSMALADAAEERGITEEEIEVVRAEEVEWPDGARGCPEEDELYTQAIVPGYLVVLDVEGEERHYHGAEGEAPFHCEDPQEPTGS